MSLTQYSSQQLYLLAFVIYCSSGDPNATQNADSPGPGLSSDDHRPTHTLHFTKNANLEQKLRSSIIHEHESPVGSSCLNHGSWIASLDRCDCPITHGGRFCEVHLCLNGGFLAEDGHSCHCGKFEGKHCEQPACVGGMLNVNGKCDCIGNYFGRFCELFCVHGRLIDGRCICYDGFEGITCTRCNATYASVSSGDCGEISRRRRPVMQSRFALSGLSLCLITIILLWISVVTRRRRTMLAASHFERMANERLLREQQRRLCERRAVAIQIPRTSRSRAVCEFRHFVQAARNADMRLVTGACGLHSPRFLRTADTCTRIHTPPPEYCATPQESPPSYEEATRSERGGTLK